MLREINYFFFSPQNMRRTIFFNSSIRPIHYIIVIEQLYYFYSTILTHTSLLHVRIYTKVLHVHDVFIVAEISLNV